MRASFPERLRAAQSLAAIREPSCEWLRLYEPAQQFASRRGCHRVVFLLGREIPGSRHARTCPKAHHRDRSRGPVSLQPEPHLSGVLHVPARRRDLGQQRVAAGHTRRGGGADPLSRYTERRRYLERKFGAQYLDYKASVRRWL